MRTFLKLSLVLVAVLGLSACSVKPKVDVESTIMQSQLDPSLKFERLSGADRQGVTTWDITQQNGVTVKAVKTNETSTSEQDMANVFAGAATGPLMNGIVAHSLKNRSSDCGDDGCGGGGQQVVQVQVDTSAVSTSNTSQSRSGGCTTCKGRKKLPTM